MNNNKLTTLPEIIENLTQLVYLHLFENNLNTLPESIEIENLTQLCEYSKKMLTNIENEFKDVFNKHKTYFHNNIFEELIMKTMHTSRMSQFIEYDSDFDSDSN